jgi:hypothetical protein
VYVVGVAGDPVVVAEQVELEPGDVEPGDVPIEVQQRSDHPPGLVRVAEEHEGPDGVPGFALAEALVTGAEAVVHLVVDRDHEGADDQRPPGAHDDGFGHVQIDAAGQQVVPPADAVVAVPIEGLAGQGGHGRRGGIGEDDEHG